MNWLRVSLSAALAMATVAAVAPVEAATPANAFVMAKNIDDIISLDPGEAFELSGLEITTNVYDRVMRYDAEDVTKLVGGAVESWTVSEDGKTFTFKIRAAMKFASGSPITADDAAFSLQRVIKLDKTPAFLISQLGWTKDNVDQMVKAVDPSTLQIVIGPKFSPSLVLSLLSSIVGSVVEKQVVIQHDQGGDLGNAWLKAHSAGSGSFTLRSWQANESVVLEANPNYREGAPPLKRVVIRHVPEPASQRLLIEKGDADIARDLSPDQVAGLAGNKDVSISISPQATLHYLGLNLAFKPFQDVRVRQAMHYLIDYDGMANSFLKGQDQVHQTFWPSGFWASLDENPYKLDQGEGPARRSRLSQWL
jgi:peptide/nickel transport system substrate-binding protein